MKIIDPDQNLSTYLFYVPVHNKWHNLHVSSFGSSFRPSNVVSEMFESYLKMSHNQRTAECWEAAYDVVSCMYMDLLGVGEQCLDLVQFDLIVECHHGDAVLSCILDVGLLLARVRVDDTIGANLHVEDTLDLTLKTVLSLLSIRYCYSYDLLTKRNKSSLM